MAGKALSQLDFFQKGRRPTALTPKEIALHGQVADTLRRWCQPTWRWTHFPAGEARDEKTGRKLKRMGLQRGWADFILVSPEAIAHFLELKRQGEHLTHEQKEFRDFCLEFGVPWAKADTYKEAVMYLTAWGCLKTKLEVQ